MVGLSRQSVTRRASVGILIGLVALLLCAGRAVAAPIPFTVGPGAVGSIGGKMGSIVSIPAGAAVQPSPQGALLPVGTVVEINGSRQTLTQPTPFVLTTGGIRPPVLPGTGKGDGTLAAGVVMAAVLLLAGSWLTVRTRRQDM